MSWLFSRRLADQYLEGSSSAGALSQLLKSTPSEPAYCSHGNAIVHSTAFPYGTTCARLTAIHGEELLTWFRAGFRVQTLPLEEPAKGSTAAEADFIDKESESLAKFDLSSPSLKTAHCSLAADSNTSFLIWPKWGMMRNGECWERPTPAQITEGSESGFWHPTPTKMDKKGATTVTMLAAEKKRSAYLRYWLHKRFPRANTTYPHPGFLERAMGFPVDWTALEPLATHKFQQWLDSHGKSSDPEKMASPAEKSSEP